MAHLQHYIRFHESFPIRRIKGNWGMNLCSRHPVLTHCWSPDPMAIIQWCIRNECVCDRELSFPPPLNNVCCIYSEKCIWKARKLFGYVRQEQNNNLAIVCQQSWGNGFVEKCVFCFPLRSVRSMETRSIVRAQENQNLFPFPNETNTWTFTTPCLSVMSAPVPWTLVLSFYELLMDSRFVWCTTGIHAITLLHRFRGQRGLSTKKRRKSMQSAIEEENWFKIIASKKRFRQRLTSRAKRSSRRSEYVRQTHTLTNTYSHSQKRHTELSMNEWRAAKIYSNVEQNENFFKNFTHTRTANSDCADTIWFSVRETWHLL